ncbi:hypothetical protein B0H66DRAFT_80060 [Apodospora peruviana]|uniref:Uncharacterized protein n=1 Tax=Apodospora peruviana TaxID=516989 RepID=A0AAE0ITC9_9PEZI|nr:hypothetical protein B0H66DRAFT_80060 [Apodospora peruviana]
MFGSRKYRPPNQPLTSATANPNATTAAAAVFRRPESNSSLLSAAAAAAALYAHPTAPTRVADVQTKRTLRRSASVASTGTDASDAYGRPSVQRRRSSSSMSERTFRSPSPHRPGSSGSQTRSLGGAVDMPPVPPLPKDVDGASQLSGVSSQHEPVRPKTNSLGMSTTPLRLASQKLGKDEGPSWFGAAKVGDPGIVRRTDPAMASPPSSPPQVSVDGSPVEGGRPGSRASSINFSYPARIRIGSPTSSPVESRNTVEFPSNHQRQRAEKLHPPQLQTSKRHSSESATSSARRRSASASSDQTLVYDPNSRRMVRRADLLAAEQAIIEASERPVKTRRKKQVAQKAGSHLSQGTMGRTKIIGSKAGHGADSNASRPQPQLPVESTSRHGAHEDMEEPAVKAIIASPRIEAKRIEQQHAQEPARQLNPDNTDKPISPEPLPAPQIGLRRQPSVVKEEPEPDDREPARSTQRTISEALDTVPSRQRVYEAEHSEIRQDTKEARPPAPTVHMHITPAAPSSASTGQTQRSSSSSTVNSPGSTHDAIQPETQGSAPLSDAWRERTQSTSPPRQARFGPVQDTLRVIHSPPPRSISPRKSALKHHSPSRGASPPPDDMSDVSTRNNFCDDQPMPRKKSVRVSFDDGNTGVVGESASTNEYESPVLSSPQNTTGSRPWYTNIARIKKDLASLDDDEIMKPRPALPSFGSVRNKKPRDLSPDEAERPLIRPIPEISKSPTLPDTPSSLSLPSINTVVEDQTPDPGSLCQSSDHAVGVLLAREHEEKSKIPANISRFREPLPPVVTTVEGDGYGSESSSSSSDFGDSEPYHETPATVETQPAVVTESQAPNTNTSLGPAISEGIQTEEKEEQRETDIPTISVTLPSPAITETKASKKFFLDIPGGFPEDDSDLSTPAPSRTASPVTAASARQATFEPVVQAFDNKTPAQTPGTVQATHLTTVEPPSDSESSIYSDAYEDLSDLEGDGFLSLNAVLESPPARSAHPPPAPQEVLKAEPVEEAATKLASELSAATTVVEPQPVEVAQEDDWDKAKAFWRTLTADKRARLEREAMEEAGMDGDLEEVNSSPKPKKKKSVERRNTERKALAIQLAQRMMAQQETDKQKNPERNYMIKPGTKWNDADEVPEVAPTMRTTLRGNPHQQLTAPRSSGSTQLRMSMRTGSDGTGAATPTSKRERPATLPTPVPVPQPQLMGQRRKTSAPNSKVKVSAELSSYHAPAIKRRGSTSSESSFKRSRAGGNGQQGFAFRQSMRQTSPTPLPSASRPNKRFSLRSLSPAGSGRRQLTEYPPIAMATNNQMRRTLRDSSEEKKSPSKVHMPTFGLSSVGKKSGGKRASKSGFSSRFGDSSDEDGAGGASGFRSRFEDSSDDEPVVPMPLPVPLPTASRPSAAPAPPPSPPFRHTRNQNSIASTALAEELEESEELLDSSDNEKKQAVAGDEKTAPASPPVALSQSRTVTGATTDLRRSRSGRGEIVVTPSQTAPALGTTTSVSPVLTTGQRPSSGSKRGSFMSVLRRKKNNSSSISRSEIAESAARRDTKLERSLDQLRGIRRSSTALDEGDEDGVEEEGQQQQQQKEQPQSPPRSPKLQKRISGFSRTASGTGAGVEGAVVSSFDPEKEELDGIGVLRRPATSGNLGTRTLSGGSVSSKQHQQAPRPAFLQNRTVSMGVLSLTGSAAGTPKKKKFGTLRRMLGLND